MPLLRFTTEFLEDVSWFKICCLGGGGEGIDRKYVCNKQDRSLKACVYLQNKACMQIKIL
jgi:hypothetical protein